MIIFCLEKNKEQDKATGTGNGLDKPLLGKMRSVYILFNGRTLIIPTI